MGSNLQAEQIMITRLSFFILLFFVSSDAFADLSFSELSPETRRLARHASDQCNNFLESPFSFCSVAGYNDSFKFPAELSGGKLQLTAKGIEKFLKNTCSNSSLTLAMTMGCSYFLPQCSSGKRVYPCKRVCNEFLKKCEKGIPRLLLDFIIASCHVLPDEDPSSGKCHEPPNFNHTRDNNTGPLYRGCQELIIPACKNLGVSNYTLVSVEQQKRLYKAVYRKEYKVEDVETGFPPVLQKQFQKYPRCKENLKKLYCGEFLPPCFSDEGPEDPGFYTICRSVCNEITEVCPDFFRNDYPDAEYCSFAGMGTTSHGYCRRTEWPRPFSWVRFVLGPEPITEPTSPPTKGPKAKVWIIVVAVLVPVIIVTLIVVGAIWWKWRRVPKQTGYQKQTDDMAPLEGAMEL